MPYGCRCTWLAYLLPTPFIWDSLIHDDGIDGGIWHYTGWEHPEIVCYIQAIHSNYSSLLDTACNLGHMLARLQQARPSAQHYGVDISSKMVSATRLRCAECSVRPFDLAQLVHTENTLDGLPTADVVVVSDVLYYMPYGGVPPWLHNAQLFPKSLVRQSQRRFFGRLQAIARKEVIFSNHQNNPAVVDFLRVNGATWLAGYGVWIAQGTAQQHAAAPRHDARQHYRFWQCRRNAATAERQSRATARRGVVRSEARAAQSAGG